MGHRPSGIPTPAEAPSGSPKKRFLREAAVLVLLAFGLALVLKTFVVEAFFIPSSSMVPTLERGDRILVNRLAYRFGDIRRGDIVVFTDPHPPPDGHENPLVALARWLGRGLGLAQPENEDFVKRVIGLPGDVVEIRSGVTFVNGRRLPEPYLNSADPDTSSYGPVTVPGGMLFVLGDNRRHSGDSRFPPPGGLGFVPQEKVIGRALVIVWPPSRIGWLR